MENPSVDPQTLQQAILDEAFWVFGFDRRSWLRRLIEPLFRRPVGRFAQLAAGYENQVAQTGLRDATHSMMPRFIEQVDIIGESRLPSGGPLLVLSNHPAAYDFFLIAATLPRDDLKLLASNINIVRKLPATADHFIFIASDGVMGDSHTRMAGLRASLRHLKAGGALLIFPTGTVDPDPAVSSEGAWQALSRWSPSLELLIRKVPEMQVVVAIVSGVLSPGWYRSPITWLRKEPHNKQKVAEIFQVMQQLFFPGSLKISPRLTFSQPFQAGQLHESSANGDVLPVLTAEARGLLQILDGESLNGQAHEVAQT